MQIISLILKCMYMKSNFPKREETTTPQILPKARKRYLLWDQEWVLAGTQDASIDEL